MLFKMETFAFDLFYLDYYVLLKFLSFQLAN